MRAMLVDNDRLLLDSLQLTIQTRNPDIEVDIAATADEALALAAINRYEIILLDWWLGSESAADCFTRLKEIASHARIVVMSGDDDSKLMYRTLELGAAGFLRKHVADFETLRHALDIVMRGGVYLPSQSPMATSVSPSVRPQWVSRELKECFPDVTERQLAVLRILLRGASDKVIARQLDIEVPTVKTHLQALYRLMGVNSRAEAVAMAARQGARID